MRESKTAASRRRTARARVLSGYTFLGRQVDVVETSRGCTFDCSFCSIIEMRGRNFHRFPIDRVLDDIADARARGARAIFFVDDNITIDVPRFEALCQAIISRGLNDIDYIVQGMTAPFATHGATLAPLMQAGGLPLRVPRHRERARRRPRVPEGARQEQPPARGEARTQHDAWRRSTFSTVTGCFVVGGLIVGNPDDTRESIDTNLEFARRYVDWPYIQHPTPYPGTPMTRTSASAGSSSTTRRGIRRDDGGDAQRASRRRGDRVPAVEGRAVDEGPAHEGVVRHDPLFVLRNGRRMLAHTFRGTTWRSALGLENSREAFRRYRAIRSREREYMDWRDPAVDRSFDPPTQTPPTLTKLFVDIDELIRQ